MEPLTKQIVKINSLFLRNAAASSRAFRAVRTEVKPTGAGHSAKFDRQRQQHFYSSLTAKQPSALQSLYSSSGKLYSSTARLPELVEYQAVKSALDNGEALVIDVRTERELVEDGVIQGALNIPLKQLKVALQMHPDDFQEKYKVSMPDDDAPIIFSCLVGGRSAKAQFMSRELGFTNVANYAGSFADWIEHAGQPAAVKLPPIVHYEAVKNHIEHGTALVVDVRPRSELVEDGVLAGSHHIPMMHIFKGAFDLPADEFEAKYKVRKPSSEDAIIFTCLAGIRSAIVESMVHEIGYVNTSNYFGGFADWRNKQA